MSVRRTTAVCAAAAVAVALALSGCGSDSQDTSSSKADAPAAAPGVAQGDAAQGAAGAGPEVQKAPPGEEQQKAPDLATENRAIIYSGTMTVRVKDVNVAAAQAIAFATAAGGFVGADNRNIDGQSSTGTITLRVPAAKFQATLDQLKTVGDEESRSLNAQDVTDQVADVDSRIKTAQASVDRIRALLARAQTIGEITSLESELSRRESDLESLQARKRRLDGLTSLSTITVVLRGPEAPVVSSEDTGIGVGLRNGWHALLASLRIALTVLGWLLPWLILVGLPAYAIVWLTRRYRLKHPAPVRAPAPAIAAPLPAYPRPPQWTAPAPPHPVSTPPVSAPPRPVSTPPRPVSAPPRPVSAPPVSTPPATSAPQKAEPEAKPSAAPKDEDPPGPAAAR